MKVVLDTHVLIAAFITHGMCSELLEHCAVRHEIVLSRFILNELREKLVRKFRFTEREAESVVHLLASRCAVVTPVPLTEPICRDADDDTVIGTALAGSCRYVVTGDKDPLDLRTVRGIQMLSPADFWRMEDQ